MRAGIGQTHEIARRGALALLTLTFVSGCMGEVGLGADADVPGWEDASTTPSLTQEACAVDPVNRMGRTPLRRMTRFEYNNTVRDLLGETTNPGNAFPEDAVSGFFDNVALTQTVNVLQAEGYMAAAEAIATKAVANLNTLLGCNVAQQGEAVCASRFIDNFGAKAYRRPLSAEESQRLVGLYTTVRGESDFNTAIKASLEAMLISPHFLFRPEFGQTEGSKVEAAKKLTGYETATRLSYFLWGSMPDEALFAAAANGSLETPDGVRTQAERMLSDAKTQNMTARMYDQWFGIEGVLGVAKDAEQLPAGVAFNDALKASLVDESRRFIKDVIWNGDAKVRTLLTAPYTYVNENSAKLYGLTGVTGAEMRRVDLDPKQRGGILTHPSFLAARGKQDQSHPIKRGEFVRTHLLCEELAAPPPGIPALPSAVPDQSTRERIAGHTSNPACASCHKLIDGAGFGFEHYNASGMYREEDGGKPVDASGELVATQDVNGPFVGTIELSAKLASSQQVQRCFAQQTLRYSQGRFESAEDTCTVFKLNDGFMRTGGDLKQLLLLTAQSDSFLHYRRAE